MTTAELEKRVRALEKKYEKLRQTVATSISVGTGKQARLKAKPTVTKKKKLPRWLQASLKDVEEGRVSGPFNTVDELMAHLQK